VTILAIVVAVVIFITMYMTTRLHRVEDNLPKRIKCWAPRIAEKSTNEIIAYIQETLNEEKLSPEQKKVFEDILKEYNRSLNDVTICKTILASALVCTFIYMLRNAFQVTR